MRNLFRSPGKADWGSLSSAVATGAAVGGLTTSALGLVAGLLAFMMVGSLIFVVVAGSGEDSGAPAPTALPHAQLSISSHTNLLPQHLWSLVTRGSRRQIPPAVSHNIQYGVTTGKKKNLNLTTKAYVDISLHD